MEPIKITDLNGFKAVLYTLFSIEAKLRVHTDLLVEMAEIITQKDPDDIRNEVIVKTVQELKNVRHKFIDDDDMINLLNSLKL